MAAFSSGIGTLIYLDQLAAWHLVGAAAAQGALYGIMSILVALTAGWLASTFFRLVFR